MGMKGVTVVDAAKKEWFHMFSLGHKLNVVWNEGKKNVINFNNPVSVAYFFGYGIQV